MTQAELLREQIELLVHKLMIRKAGFLESGAAGLTQTELKVVALLARKGVCIMREVADTLGMARNNLTVVADDLESRGLIIRRRSETDRRVVHIAVTPAGAAVAAEESRVHLEFASAMLEPLLPEEREDLLRLLSRITAT